MLDERAVSWKILLPFQEDGRALVCGLEIDEIAGLARSCSSIDWLPSGAIPPSLSTLPSVIAGKVEIINREGLTRREYDLVVLGASDQPLSSCVQGLKKNGVLVCVGFLGCRHKLKSLQHLGFQNIQQYGVLPTNRPRIIYPLQTKRLRGKGLTLHSPGSSKARYALHVIKLMSNWGISAPLCKGSVIIARRTHIPVKNNLQQWLQDRLQQDIVDLVVYCGSDSARRKMTLLAVGEDGKNDYIVKVADSTGGSNAIECETLALKALASSNVSGSIPQLLFTDHWNGYQVQVQTALPKPKDQLHTLTDTHLTFLAELTRLDSYCMALAETTIWRNTVKHIERTESVFPSAIAHLATEVVSQKFKQTNVYCHRIHGDFTPWNTSITDKSLMVWDWEDSEAKGLVFFDLCQFIIRQAVLVGPWPGATVLLRQLQHACTSLCTAGHIPAETNYIPTLKIWILAEYLNTANHQLLELATSLQDQTYA